MCDYSISGFPNRLANEREQLMLYRFPSSTKGFVSPIELGELSSGQTAGWWAKARAWFCAMAKTPTAVCIPPGARLMLRDVPENLQRRFSIGADAPATFTQLSANSYEYRDAVKFASGEEVLIQQFPVGQRADVLSLGSGTEGGVTDPREAIYAR